MVPSLVSLNNGPATRSAGILMHISSLPASFGVGDFGPEAKGFADFLHRTHQHYWQILPLNPTGPERGYSPYSSTSSIAGNTLLISPELLVADGLLDETTVQGFRVPPHAKADYLEATKIKTALLDDAYNTFRKEEDSLAALHEAFASFCDDEKNWLNDFSLYCVLTDHHKGPWYQWPDEFRLREPSALHRFAGQHENAIDRVKWSQFIFFRQWKALKKYCNALNIQLFGDLPFYVSHDAVDVWTNPGIFCLDKNGKMMCVAGVPPDYFNDNGQRWGMPVFRWDVLKEQQYNWWVQRIRKNMELYDLLRLDHFRAFSEYWEVPAEEKTAVNGKWKPGPGAHLFQALKTTLGSLPFVAEDLGDINEAVHTLRNACGLPGMCVLQFAFGENMPYSEYIPHHHLQNSVVYTGTHDNNTTRGWFTNDADKKIQERLQQYTGRVILEKKVHEVLGRMAYASVAKIAILPMQDILGLDETARMNTPASTEGNWLWRLQAGMLTTMVEERLREWTTIYDRVKW